MPKPRRCIILIAALVVIVACGGLAAHKFLRPGLPWPEVALKNMTLLEMVRGEEAFAFSVESAGWVLFTDKGHSRANEERLAQFLEALSVIGKDREPWADTSWPAKERGLAVALTTDKNRWQMFVDKGPDANVPAGKARVVVVFEDDKAAMLVDARLIQLLSLPLAEYADLRLFDLRPERITRLTVSMAGMEEWDLSRVQDGVFRFLKPDNMRHVELAQAAIEFYLYAVASLRSPDFLQYEEDLGYPLPEKLLEVAIWSDDAAGPEKLSVYHQPAAAKTGPFVAYSSRQNGYLAVPEAKVQQLSNALASLRNHPVLPQGIGQVDRVLLTTWSEAGEPRQYAFVRENEEWRRNGSKDSLVGMDALIWRLGTLQTDGKNNDSAPKNPVRLMRWDFFRHNSSTPVLVLSFSNEQDKDGVKSWVQVGADGPWFPLQSQVVSEILGHLPAPLEN